MTGLADWLDRHTARAPAALGDRVRRYALAAPAERGIPAALAEAARTALDRVTSAAGDRTVALDLLAADALITLALLAQSETAPDRLGEFAATLVHVRADA